LASAAFVVTGVISTGGLRALVAKKLSAKNAAKYNKKNSSQNPNPKEETWAK
jgi:hypothetical protein